MKRIGLLFIAVFIISCSENKKISGDDVPSPSEVPETLDFKPSLARNKLSSDEVIDLKDKIGSKAQMAIPDMALVLGSKNISANQLQKMESNLQQQDQNSYEFYKSLQSSCVKNRPKIDSRISLPADKDYTDGNLRIGDYLAIDVTASLKGNKCPVGLDAFISRNFWVDSIDRNKDTTTVKGTSTIEMKLDIVDPKYAKLLNSRGIIVSSTANGLSILQNAQNRILLKFGIQGQYLSLSEKIPYNAQVTTLLKHDSSNAQQMETIVKMTLEMPRGQVAADIYLKGTIARYFVNGYELNKAEFDSMFGTENPALNLNASTVSGF
jgi:hypothetical protein